MLFHCNFACIALFLSFCAQESIAALKKEKESLQEQLNTAHAHISAKEIDSLKASNELESKEKEISLLKETVKTLNASKTSEIDSLKEQHTREQSDLILRVQALEAELVKSKQDSSLFTAMVSKFTDPVTNAKHKCPVIQANGVIRSLSEIISVWLKDLNMGQSNAFRMFQCPVLKNFTMIASFPIVDSFLKVAESLMVDVSPPIVFVFKKDSLVDSWVEFSFHEQLELIARLCDVYNQRKNAATQPEQRNVSVGGMSFLISMHAVAHGKRYRLQCFGINNNGGGKVDIRVSFSPGWVHPFTDMDFSVDG